MCNFFAQADALATGKSPEELREEGVAPFYVPHKTFSGNRPSSSLLLPAVNPYTVGQLLALYEARVAAQGFIWGINAFDQWGVELGKVLATRVRHSMSEARTKNRPMDVTDGYNPSTRKMINRYLAGKTVRLLVSEGLERSCLPLRLTSLPLSPSASHFPRSFIPQQQLYPEPRDVFPCDLIATGEGCTAPYEESDDE